METPWNNPVPWLIFGGIAEAVALAVFVWAVKEARRRAASPAAPLVSGAWALALGFLLLAGAAEEGALDSLLASYPGSLRQAVVSDIRAASHALFYAASWVFAIVGISSVVASVAVLAGFPRGRAFRLVALFPKAYWRLVERRGDLRPWVRMALWLAHMAFGLALLYCGTLGVWFMFALGPKSSWFVAWSTPIAWAVIFVANPWNWDEGQVSKLEREHPASGQNGAQAA